MYEPPKSILIEPSPKKKRFVTVILCQIAMAASLLLILVSTGYAQFYLLSGQRSVPLSPRLIAVYVGTFSFVLLLAIGIYGLAKRRKYGLILGFIFVGIWLLVNSYGIYQNGFHMRPPNEGTFTYDNDAQRMGGSVAATMIPILLAAVELWIALSFLFSKKLKGEFKSHKELKANKAEKDK